MSTFTLGQLQVRRSGYGAMQLAGPFTSGTVRRCRASRNSMEPRFQCARQRPIFMINLSPATLSQDRAARCRSLNP